MEQLKSLGKRLLKMTGRSGDTIIRILTPMKGMTSQQKETRAAQILSIMDSSENEQEFLQKLQEQNLL